MTDARVLTAAQYRQLVANERPQGPHRASTPSHHIYFLARRNVWMTARAGRSGTVVVRFYGRCPCED